MSIRTAVVVLLSLGAVLEGREARAQHFGRNKVEYVDFEFRVFETEHFAVYHYRSEEPAARIVARLAERWYARLSRVLEHTLDSRQALILYGSQPEFAQTNVVDGFLGEGIGGVTESARRRIVMPFAPTLAETDRILGHELTHAFQFDIARQYGGGLSWPLWSIEGLAQYLALGAADAETAMWLRDAVVSDLLPNRQQDAAHKFSPYRYGHALWAYAAGRFGDRVIPAILKAKSSGSLSKRIKNVTGFDLDSLYAEWRTASIDVYGGAHPAGAGVDTPSAFAGAKSGRIRLGPTVSPNGQQLIFFSEKDRVSLDLFLADTATGRIVRKLATTAASARFESLQAIRSAGSWSPEGDRFVFAAIDRGEPALVLLDIRRPGQQQEIRLPRFGQILTPAWSPDGRAIAFAALDGGITDIFVYDLRSGSLQQLTDDAYGDMQPQWSPDGRSLAFVTDRFSTDLSSLRFGNFELAIVDVGSGAIRAVRAIPAARHGNPQWAADGESLYFLSAPDGVSNVFRVHLQSRRVRQITAVRGGVTGLTPTSPALSAARGVPAIAFTVYRKGQYEIDMRRGDSALEGTLLNEPSVNSSITLPPVERQPGDRVEQALEDTGLGLTPADALVEHAYDPDMFLEAIGPPYLSSGGGPFGTFVRAGGSMLFSDLLGERKVALSAQAGNRLRDLAVALRFVNRERRWNWGGVAEVQPSLRRLPRTLATDVEGEPAITRENHYFERTQFRLAGLLAYPLNRSQRFEFEAGARHTIFRRSISTVSRSSASGRVLNRTTADGSAGAPATVGEASVAFVSDTAVFGPLSPILGARSRYEITSTFGELSTTRLLLDHRRYVMPIRPYTLAVRLLHLGQYGKDADDLRLLPAFLGSRQFLRGYGWNSIHCQPGAAGACASSEELLGSRLLVTNLEVRAPLLGVRGRDLRYGPVPLEGFLFADSGLVWARTSPVSTARPGRRLVSSAGAGVRVNAFGLPLELAAVRAADAPSRGWSFDINFRSGF
jgi:Tol biopolymer transport system component